MKYALLIVLMPATTDAHTATNAMGNFFQEVERQKTRAGLITQMNPCTYLCDLSHGLAGLLALDAAARDRKYATHTLFFDQQPAFVPPMKL